MRSSIALFAAITCVCAAPVAQSTLQPDTYASLDSDSALATEEMIDLQSIIGQNIEITAHEETGSWWWVGTTNGLYRIKKKNRKVFRFDLESLGVASNHVNCLCSRSDGHVFIGTDRGIAHYDMFAFFPINAENSKLLSNNVTSIDCNLKTSIAVRTDWSDWYVLK